MNLKLVNKNPLKRSPDWSSSGSEKYLPWLSGGYVAQRSALCMLSAPLFQPLPLHGQASPKVWEFHVGSAAGFLLSLTLHV